MSFVKLSNMPSPPKLRVSSVQNMKGGLNIHDLAWQIKADQSPEMKNMWWRDGVLQSRPSITAHNNGVVLDRTADPRTSGASYPAYPHPYYGWYVFKHPDKGDDREWFVAVAESDLQHYVDIPYLGEDGQPVSLALRGTFFMYNGVLYYKSRGAYIRFLVSEDKDETTGNYLLKTERVEGYIPTTYINAKPANGLSGADEGFGGGVAYQPVNRLSPWRCITYNFGAEDTCLYIPELYDIESISDNIILEYLTPIGTWTGSGIELNASNVIQLGDRTKITVGTALSELLTEVGTLSATNNVRVTYKVGVYEGTTAMTVYQSIAQCDLAVVYGGGAGLCVVMAGCDSQPNAYFWSGNTNVAMDPTYFPVENYNLAGDMSDPITAFGKQQNMLAIFQEHQIGRCVFGTTEIDARVFITMDYAVINPGIGCDVPNSVQLIENNLVFANKKYGVMYIKDTSSAYENNIVNISQNIEPSASAPGLFLDLNKSNVGTASYDDGKRYWLCVNDHIWLWDYSLGGSINNPEALSWFYFDRAKTPACWLALDREMPVYIGTDGYLREFKTLAEDVEYEGVWVSKNEDFEKVLTLPIQDFGTYEALKNVVKTIFVVKSAGDSTINIEYETDYCKRTDLAPIVTHGMRAWVPRDLTVGRSLVFTRFAVTAVRKPRCLHVRHFLVRLTNAARGEDFAFVSAQIYFNLQGADR